MTSLFLKIFAKLARGLHKKYLKLQQEIAEMKSKLKIKQERALLFSGLFFS
jgi:5-carboxymethyl-2-hydroxymuconate isomerase